MYTNDNELAQASNIEKNMKTPKKPYSACNAVPHKNQPNGFNLKTEIEEIKEAMRKEIAFNERKIHELRLERMLLKQHIVMLNYS